MNEDALNLNLALLADHLFDVDKVCSWRGRVGRDLFAVTTLTSPCPGVGIDCMSRCWHIIQ